MASLNVFASAKVIWLISEAWCRSHLMSKVERIMGKTAHWRTAAREVRGARGRDSGSYRSVR